MGNCPSISLVLRTIVPCLENGLVAQQGDRDRLDPVGGDDPAQLAQRLGRDVRLELAADRALQLGPLDREPVGVGRDHRHLGAAGADQDAGQDRPHVVARGGAGDEIHGRGKRRAPGSSAARPPPRGRRGSPRWAGRAGGSSSRRCGSRRRARPRAARSRPSGRRASGRARRAGGREGGPSRRSSASAASFVFRPISRSVAQRLTPSSSAVSRIPESDWVAARVDTARETTESLATSSSRLVVSFK